MRDIGGEAFNRLDAIVEGLGHIAEGAGQVADLVRAAGEIGDLPTCLFTSPHAFSRSRQAPYGFGYGSGDEKREKKHDEGGNKKDPDDGQVFRGDDLVNVVALRR